MVRHPSCNYVFRPRNLSQNTTGIPDAASIWPNAILNIKYVADWKHIRQRKQLRINHNNKRENMHQNNHQYKVSEKILVKRKKNSKHELEFMCPFPITKINDNGTFCFQKGIINDAVNIRRIKPFFD